MPIYEYYCPKCQKGFGLMRRVSKMNKPAFCPMCHEKVERLVSAYASEPVSGQHMPSGNNKEEEAT